MSSYTINLSGKILEELDAFAKRNNISRAEAAKRAFALLAVANTAAQHHDAIGIVQPARDDEPEKVIKVLAGV
jgi:metal-responsive CopG/Arc/MetJ family transcriptional regulator